MKSFRALLQRHVLNSQTWQSREDLHFAIVHWIEHTHNRQRRMRRLGKVTTVQYGLAIAKQDVRAAA